MNGQLVPKFRSCDCKSPIPSEFQPCFGNDKEQLISRLERPSRLIGLKQVREVGWSKAIEGFKSKEESFKNDSIVHREPVEGG